MSTSATPASTSAPSPVQSPAGLRKAAAQAGTDLFASLLALVGDTRQGEALAADPLAADSALPESAGAGADLSADASWNTPLNNPLSNLLNWAYPSGLGDLSAMAEAPGRGGAELLAHGAGRGAPTPLGLGASPEQRPTPGIDLSGLGLTPVVPGEKPDAHTTALLARGLPASIPASTPTTTLPAATAAEAVPLQATPAPLVNQAVNLAQTGTRATVLAGQPAAETPSSSAVDKGRKSGLSVTATLQARDAAGHDMARLQPHALPPTPRSTVALDSRLGSTTWRTTDLETPSLAPAGALTSELRRASGDRPAPRDLLAPLAPEVSLAAGKSSEAAPRTEGEARADHLPGSPEAELETPGHLGAHQLRHATLRVGEGSAEAIDVQLSISGQEVRVDFRTDSAEARQGLQQSAAPALGELLERSGMQLGGVSVGGQGLASGGGQGSDADAQRRSPERGARVTESTEPAAAPARPRTDGSRPLDVFA